MMRALLDYCRSIDVRQWLIQSVFIICAVLLSVLTVTWVLEKSLIREALEMEAEAFIQSWSGDNSFPLPRTRNLTGYMSHSGQADGIPAELRQLPPGLHNEVDIADAVEAVPVYVRDFSGQRLYLVFNGANVDRLVGIFGLLPLASLLIVIYAGTWVAYRLTSRAMSPVLRIAKNLRETGPDNFSLGVQPSSLRGEARELADAIEQYRKRSELLVEKERQFTADVSHELRTPITIIDGASQFLAAEARLSEKGAERVQMIRRACRDVSELINAFLLLSRSKTLEDDRTLIPVSQLILSEIEKLRPFVDTNRVQLRTDLDESLQTPTPRKAMEIIIGNLLGNAVKYTNDGTISVYASDNRILIEDTGIGIPEDILPHLFERHVRGRGLQQAGEGIGLAIVKRLCDQFDWDIRIQNIPDGGVSVLLSKSEKH